MKKTTLCIILIGAVMILLNSSFLNQPLKKVALVFIGDSITECGGLEDPAKQAPSTIVANYLKEHGVDVPAYSNQGHGGATTLDFLPASGYYKKMISVADSFASDNSWLLVFSIMLGANDSAIEGTHGSPVNPENYANNLKQIINSLLVRYPGCKIILHYPLWYSPNTHNSAKYLQKGLSRLQQYSPQIASLVDHYRLTEPDRVFEGDKKGFAYFKKTHEKTMRPQKGKSGIFYLHPNEKGSADLGKLWYEAIYSNVIK